MPTAAHPTYPPRPPTIHPTPPRPLQTYVVEGAAHAPHVLSFDRQQHQWRQCTGLATPRVNMAVCALEGLLYVLVRHWLACLC